MSKKVHIGKLGKSHGVHGAFRLSLKDSFIGIIEKGKIIHARLDGLDIPLIVSGVRGDKENIVTFKGLDNADRAKPFIGKELYADVEENMGLSTFDQLSSFNGFEIINQNDEKIGEIIRTEEYPQQLMAIVRWGEEQILIPIVEDFISEIDIETKTIWMNLPGGLLEL